MVTCEGSGHTSRLCVKARPARLTCGPCSGIGLRVREPFSWYVSWYLWQSGGNGMYLIESLTPDMQSRIALGMGGSGGLAGRPKCVSPDGRPCGRLLGYHT